MTESDGRMQQDGVPKRASTIDDLVAEMSVLRKAVEGLYELHDERESPTDYSGDIAALAKAVNANSVRIKAVEDAPALAITAEDHAAAIGAAVAGAAALVQQEYKNSKKALDDATAMVGKAFKRDRIARKQDDRNMMFLAAGAGTVAALWLFAAVALHPAYSSWPWRAAHSLTLWDLGWELLAEANSKSHARVIRADTIYLDDRGTIDRCLEVARERGEIVSCRINVSPPPQ